MPGSCSFGSDSGATKSGITNWSRLSRVSRTRARRPGLRRKRRSLTSGKSAIAERVVPPRLYALRMSPAALLAATLLVPAVAPASIDFGAVQLGGAALHRLAVPALGVSVSGAGFSATRTAHGVLIVFEPYELGEEAAGTLTLTLASGVTH